MSITLESARRAKEEAKRRFKGDRSVVGIGIGQQGQDYCLRINLARDKGDGPRPETIAGVPVEYVRTGIIKALPAG